MFNRHQAEITVMQFRGHSLLVHHSVVYHGNFFSSSHFISQFSATRFPLITAIRMCHFLPVHHLEWHFWPGQNITPGSDGNKGVHCIHQNANIPEASSSYIRDTRWGSLTPLQRCSRCILQLQDIAGEVGMNS